MSSRNVSIEVSNTPGARIWEQAANVEATRFLSESYFSSREEIDDTYEEYNDRTFFVLASDQGEPLASARIIRQTQSGLIKTMADLFSPDVELAIDPEEQETIDAIGLSNICDFATISTTETKNTKSPLSPIKRSAFVVGGVMAVAEHCDATHLIAGIDEDACMFYERLYGESIRKIGQAQDYYGSPCYPLLVDVHKVLEVKAPWLNKVVTIGHSAVQSTLDTY